MKKIKGFTLIECLIALAVLGIASLTMAEIYGRISQVNRNNHMVNTSLAYQMKEVEQKTDTAAIKIPADVPSSVPYTPSPSGSPSPDPNGKAPHLNSVTNRLQIERVFPTTVPTKDKCIYSYPVDMYVLLSRDSKNNQTKVPVDTKDSNGNLVKREWKDNTAYNGLEEKDISLRYKYLLGYSG